MSAWGCILLVLRLETSVKILVTILQLDPFTMFRSHFKCPASMSMVVLAVAAQAKFL